MMSQQWFFHWENAPLLIAAMVFSWCNARGVQWLEHPPYSPYLAPADFSLLKIAKIGAGRPEPGPGWHQKRLGGGNEITDRCRLRRRLQKLAGALQKVRPPQRQVHQKILRNKHPLSSNRRQFIYRFAFVCIHTSYLSSSWSLKYYRLFLVSFSILFRLWLGRNGRKIK
jgi:hypothetical protein